MCKHLAVVVASRNAIVPLVSERSIASEIQRRVNYYDSLMDEIESDGCKHCESDEYIIKNLNDIGLTPTEGIQLIRSRFSERFLKTLSENADVWGLPNE